VTGARGFGINHLEADPFEETNIIGRPDASGTLERMKSQLHRLLDQTK
jgi:hypothetical protein